MERRLCWPRVEYSRTNTQLQSKITELEGKAGSKAQEAKDAVKDKIDSLIGGDGKPAPKLVLMGPPGAGE